MLVFSVGSVRAVWTNLPVAQNLHSNHHPGNNRPLCCSFPCVCQLLPRWLLNVEGWMNIARPVHQSKTQARCAEVRDFPVVGTWRLVFRRDRVFWNEHKIWNAVTYWIVAAMFNPFSAALIALLVEFPFKIFWSMTMSQRDVKLTRTVHLESVPQRMSANQAGCTSHTMC